MSQPTAPVGDSLTPDALNRAIQLPPAPADEQPLPYFNPEADRTIGAATPKTIEDTLDSLPSAMTVDPNADPDTALRDQLKALQGELAELVTEQEKRAEASDADTPREYVFESSDLAGAIILTLKDRTTFLVQFRNTPIVRRGRLTQRGVWRSQWLPFEIKNEPGKVEDIVAALKRTDDFKYGHITAQETANAQELTAEMMKLRGAIHSVHTGALPSNAPADVNYDESMRAVPKIARSQSLPQRQ